MVDSTLEHNYLEGLACNEMYPIEDNLNFGRKNTDDSSCLEGSCLFEDRTYYLVRNIEIDKSYQPQMNHKHHLNGYLHKNHNNAKLATIEK